MPSTYDYTFDCKALAGLLPTPGAEAIVTHWQGTEAVSRPYRFEITLALRQGDLELEKLLDQPATLASRTPDGGLRRWNGIITQGAEQGRDDVHYYYQVVLEPRMVRLRTIRWSDIYLQSDLSDLIKELLAYAELKEPYRTDGTAYDYRIAATQLSATKTEFTCQFEENCLDFLMRKLEYYGVYFWFEQDGTQESVVFANDVGQQPQDPDVAVYYPKGIIDPDVREIAVARLNRRVGMPRKLVVLRDTPDQANTSVTLSNQANVPAPATAAALGEFHSSRDHYEKLDGTAVVSGAMLANWRAQELACQRMRVEGEARTPGIRAARLLSVSQHTRGVDTRQYYVIEVSHEGSKTVETSPHTDHPAYRASFVALPRWLDPADDTSDPLQYRPPLATPVPQVDRLVNGFIDIANPATPKRFAQPDADGRYKVRFLFAHQRYDGDSNSAFVRMATPYAAGASTSDLQPAGMHFPLREGTEVLLAFINGNPDRPVIVSALPNTEAPSVVNAANSAHHRIGTPGGNTMVLADADPGGAGQPAIRLFSPTEDTSLNLGASDEEGVNDGYHLTTELHGDIYAGSSLLIEVPGHYRVAAGSDSNETQANFLGSEAEDMPSGISVGQKGGIVVENFLGMKIESVEGITAGHFFGAKAEMCEAAAFETSLGFKLSVEGVAAKEINLLEKNIVRDSALYTNAVTRWIAGKWNGIAAEKTEEVGEMKITALENYKLFTPDIWAGSVASSLQINPAGVKLGGVETTVSGWTKLTLDSSISATLEGGISSLNLTSASALLESPSIEMNASEGLSIETFGECTVNGSVIMLG